MRVSDSSKSRPAKRANYGCVELSSVPIRTAGVAGAISAVCERLVDPSVQDGRTERRNLVGLLLVGPFIVASGLAVVLPAQLGLNATLAAICATLGAGWLAALLAASGRATGPIEVVALLAATISLAALIAASGGIVSPMMAMLAALPVEALLLRRTRKAVAVGLTASAAALALQQGLSAAFDMTAPSVWCWLLPLAYAAVLVPRLTAIFRSNVEADGEFQFNRMEDLIGGVLVSFNRSGEVVDLSSSAGAMFGVPSELLLGAGLFERVHVADRVQYLCAVSDMSADAVSRSMQVRLRLPKQEEAAGAGAYRLFFINLVRQGDGFVAAIRNVDELASLRAELDAAREAADEGEIAKGRFLAAVSHELRTPLNSIIGFSDMLLHEMFGPFQDARQREYVGVVRDAGHHLLSVVNSMLDTSKIESGTYATNPESFRFREAVEVCHAMLSVQATGKSIDFTTDIAPDVGEVRADRQAVRQMLINLASNALKFTPDGGAVAIGARRAGTRLNFWVSDNGIGIAEEDLANLGKPFTQIQSDYTRHFEGTGLGLSLVKGLVALHEGSMTVESAPGQGTTVTISLPLDGPGRQKLGGRGVLVALPSKRAKEDGDETLRKTA